MVFDKDVKTVFDGGVFHEHAQSAYRHSILHVLVLHVHNFQGFHLLEETVEEDVDGVFPLDLEVRISAMT